MKDFLKSLFTPSSLWVVAFIVGAMSVMYCEIRNAEIVCEFDVAPSGFFSDDDDVATGRCRLE